jgi:Helicase conserved C-terminal domain
MNRPETERFLSSLKDFQRDTVDYVFARMYEQASPAMRFLVADEVGLGKTKIAAGIIARAVDRLKTEDPARRIDVIYICSNSGIARQNINRLNVTGQPCHDLPDRITLLPRDISRLRKNTVNFIAFTPGTSLSIRSSGGKASERALLFWLLPDDWVANKRGSLSLLTGGMSRDRFKGRVDEHPQSHRIDEKLKADFRLKLGEVSINLGQPEGSIRERFLELADQLGGREHLSDEERRKRTEIVGTLRSTLAGVCIESLKPHLVILDEFQRFSDLLHGQDEASQLAQQLFRFRDVRILLLSATPYRMFTTADQPGGDGHYTDLIQTISFLQDDPRRTQAFQSALAAYGKELFRIGIDNREALRHARDEVASILRRVMVRTERLAVTADRSGMLREVTCPDVRLVERDIDSFLALQRLARSLDAPDVMEYWKSAPYLVNFMDEYDLKRSVVDDLESCGLSAEIFQALSGDTGLLLSRGDVSAYRELDPGNARLRNLIHEMLDCDAWRLLWIPPSWRYYESGGEFASPAALALTKRLIFSSWQVVPKVVAALMTYEAERRMLGIGPRGEPASQGPESRKKHAGLLRFSDTGTRLTGMPVLGLLYPSFTLASEVDPLEWARSNLGSPMPTLQDVLERARSTCARLLEVITKNAPSDGDIDERWYWAAPILLDLNRDAASAKAWFGQANLAAQWRGPAASASDDELVDELDAEAQDAWSSHVRTAREIAGGSAYLGRPPADLAEVLALNAIGGPAVTALRALARVAGGLQRVTNKSVRNQAGQVAEGFRSLFNQPDVTVMLRQQEPYWQRVLEYCSRGGLQAVLDEYAHVLVEHLGVSGRPVEQIERSVAKAMREALTLRTATVGADSVEVDEVEKNVKIGEKMRFRTRFAVRYGGRAQAEAQTVQREGDVQQAFNSPFWPFVLCSTSVGQEGLDFHLYCHAVMHWNLPSNPVDLEQREGRVHRYKGHAVRKNVAQDFSVQATYSTSGPDSDSWRQLFELARNARADDLSDLVPFWVYTTEGGAHIERHLPMIPLSKDVNRADVLRRSLAVYRMAFGQSRQEDLVEYLQRYLTTDQIKTAVAELRIDLTPELSPNRHESGVLQIPGELTGEESDTEVGSSRFGLVDLEDLLESFVAIMPVKKRVSSQVLEGLIDDFVALRNP